jgi:hypothetical protein
MKTMVAAASTFALSAPAVADEIVLECELPGAGTPGVEIGWGAKWHGFIAIDKTWTVDDYVFKQRGPNGTIEISRNSGAIVQTEGEHRRTGTCKRASKEDRRF